jgi:hypothetical protein
MKTIFSKITVLLFVFMSVTSQSQDKTEKQKQLEMLLESKEFVFIPETAIPQGLPSVNLSSSNNFVKVHPETVEGQLPYFGSSPTATPSGGDSDIRFNAAPSEYKLVKDTKDYKITATVKGGNDSYKLYLTIAFDGSATLLLSSNNRSASSYSGKVSSAGK